MWAVNNDTYPTEEGGYFVSEELFAIAKANPDKNGEQLDALLSKTNNKML